MRSPNPHFFSLRGLERPLKAAIQRFNDLWDSTVFSQMGRAGVHRPINPICSARAGVRQRPWHPLALLAPSEAQSEGVLSGERSYVGGPQTHNSSPRC